MNWNLWPFKHLRLFYHLRTPRKSRWRPAPTLMILWWRTSRRQRRTQGIPLPLLRSPPSKAQCNPSGIARFRAFPSQWISLLWVSHLLTVAQALVSQNSNSSGLASSIREEFQRKHLTGWVHWFHFSLPDSLTQPQVPELQLPLDDSSPGSLSSPSSMVQKRKPVIDTIHKWLDAYTTYKLVIVAAYPRCSIELLKYQQIISRVETQFQGFGPTSPIQRGTLRWRDRLGSSHAFVTWGSRTSYHLWSGVPCKANMECSLALRSNLIYYCIGIA